MDLRRFESQTQQCLEQTLNQLQTATLLISALELQLIESGNTVKDLSRVIETFILENADRTPPES